MRYYIKTEGELITLVYYAPTDGATEVEAPEDFIKCGDTANKYKYVDGKVVVAEGYVEPFFDV